MTPRLIDHALLPALSLFLVALLVAPGCMDVPVPVYDLPSVAPATQPTGAPLRLEAGAVTPMYREVLAVDLPTVAAVAAADNLEVLAARQRVEANRGRYESAVGGIFPVIAPGIFFEHTDGTVRATQGNLLPANFNFVQPVIAIQWAVNPGRVVYDIVAARKRLEASRSQERFVVMDTLRAAATLYYDLVLAQVQLGNANQAVAEGEELVRITALRRQRGTGLPADELRARAALAGRRQDLTVALNAFYQTSIRLAVALRLDPSVTLVPRPGQIAPTRLVSEDLGIDRLMALAADWRPDLRAARTLADAGSADTSAATWGNLGPQVQGGYQFSGLASESNPPDTSSSLHEQHRATAGLSWSLGVSTMGNIRTARALEAQAGIDAQRVADEVRAQVVRAAQDAQANARLIPIAAEQLTAAQEALRLTEANLRAGTVLALDALQAADAVNEARFRYARAVARYNQSQVELLAALGLIDAARLAPRATAPATRPAPTAAPAQAPAR